MASLGSLKRKVKRLDNEIDDLEDDIDQLKKRRRDVDAVKKALSSTVRSDTRDCNSDLRSAAGKLNAAIDYSGKEEQISNILAHKEEEGIGTDDNLTLADKCLQQELDDIDEQLEKAKDSLKEAKEERRETKREIREKEDEED